MVTGVKSGNKKRNERAASLYSVLLTIPSKGLPIRAIDWWTRLQADRKHIRFIAVT